MTDLMTLIDGFFEWIAANYRSELYMAGTRWSGVLCSVADIAMIWMFLRLRDEIHKEVSRRRYMALVVFAALTPTLLLVKSSTVFFPLQGFVLAAPYVILVWTAAAEAGSILTHIRDKMKAQ